MTNREFADAFSHPGRRWRRMLLSLWAAGVLALAGSIGWATDATAVVQHTLSVTVQGGGTVTGPGINCPGDCAEGYDDGTVVNLAEAPPPYSTFGGWSGACTGTGPCQVTMTTDHTVTATFNFSPPASPATCPAGGCPTNQFSTAVKSLKNGTAKLTVTVPGAGHLSIQNAPAGRSVGPAKTASGKIKPVAVDAPDAGAIDIVLRPAAATRRKLVASTVAIATVRVTYSRPGALLDNAEQVSVRLKRPR